MRQIDIKQKFRIEGNRVVNASWEDDENWMEIYSKKKYKKMIKQVCNQIDQGII